LRIAQHHGCDIEILLRAGAGPRELLGAVERLLRIDQRRLDLGEIGLLQIVVDREYRLTLGDRVAFAHRKRLHAADFVGRDKNEIGLDPALIDAVVFLAGTKGQRRRKQTGRCRDRARAHDGLRAKSRST
jgi:hypothetical protein